MRFAYLIPPMMLLAACGQEEKAKDGTEISINAGDENGGVQITTSKDGSGKIKIGGNGAGIDINVPDFVDFDVTGDFDIAGVKLYPGSQITNVDVNANDNDGAKKAVVKLGFTSPAAPAKAAEWMAGEFAKKGVKISRTGDALAGKDSEGNDFSIKFGPDGTASKGEVLITKS